MFKRILSLFLATILLFGTLSVGFVSTSAADDTMDKLEYLIKKFPHGKYWNHVGSKNNPDGVTDTPCPSHSRCGYYPDQCDCNSFRSAIQCMGYALKVSNEITGKDWSEYEETSTLDVSKLRVGDIIRADNHSVCVTGVNGDKISFTDCNYGARCIIRWMTVDKSWFGRVEYVSHLKGNERTNTDVNFHDAYKDEVTDPEKPTNPDNPDVPDEPDTSNAEIWQMEDDSGLYIRSSMDTGSERTGYISAGDKFNVYEKKIIGEYLWAKVKYQDVTGYSVLNYSGYVSGSYEELKLEKLEKSYNSNESISLKWNAIGGADKYTVSLCDESGKTINIYTSKTASLNLEGIAAGKYQLSVTAESSFASSWKLTSEKQRLTVKEVYVPVTKVSLRKTGAIEIGKSGSFKPVIEPANASNKELTWSTYDKNIATVDSNGVVTGVKAGKVVIKCTSKDNPKLSASCDFTVGPASVSPIQSTAGTTQNSIGLKWEKSAGADGYAVYRYDETSKKFVRLAAGNGTAYVDKGLEPSRTYTYAVRAYAKTDDGVIQSDYELFTAKTVPTPIYTIKQTGSDTGRVRVEWEKKAGADGYVVFKYNPTKKAFEKLGATTKTGFIDSDKPATRVYYRVVSAIRVGDGLVGSKSSSTVNAITGLEKPEVKSSSKSSTVTLSWNDVNYATHYQIFKVVDGKNVLLKTVTASTTSYTDKDVKEGKTYTYYVRSARNHSSALKLYSSNVTITQKVAK